MHFSLILFLKYELSTFSRIIIGLEKKGKTCQIIYQSDIFAAFFSLLTTQILYFIF